MITPAEVLNLISDNLLDLPRNFPTDGNLFHEGLDSMGIMQLVLLVEQEFQITLEPTDLDQQHFETAESFTTLLNKKST